MGHTYSFMVSSYYDEQREQTTQFHGAYLLEITEQALCGLLDRLMCRKKNLQDRLIKS